MGGRRTHAPDQRQLLGREDVLRQPPVNLKEGDEELFRHEYARTISPTVLFEMRDVRALANGYLFCHGRLRPESFATPPRGWRTIRAALRTAQHRIFSRESRVDRALFVTDEFSNGYFHWVCDVLPRLEALDGKVLHERTLIVPAMANLGYVTESLEPYGLTDRRLFSWTDRVMCRDLLAVSPAAPTGNYRPSLMTALRHRMRSHFAPVTAVRRMYISRSASRVRRIVNEEEILPMLRKFGFETILTERLSFSEQVRIAGSTTHLIGNHGAGLTNMCWMNPGTTVLEIRRRGDRMNNCYYSLAAALGIHYRYLLCDAIDDRRDTHTADVVVDIRQLERELEALG